VKWENESEIGIFFANTPDFTGVGRKYKEKNSAKLQQEPFYIVF